MRLAARSTPELDAVDIKEGSGSDEVIMPLASHGDVAITACEVARDAACPARPADEPSAASMAPVSICKGIAPDDMLVSTFSDRGDSVTLCSAIDLDDEAMASAISFASSRP